MEAGSTPGGANTKRIGLLLATVQPTGTDEIVKPAGCRPVYVPNRRAGAACPPPTPAEAEADAFRAGATASTDARVVCGWGVPLDSAVIVGAAGRRE